MIIACGRDEYPLIHENFTIYTFFITLPVGYYSEGFHDEKKKKKKL